MGIEREEPDRRPEAGGAALSATAATWSVETVGAGRYPSPRKALRVAVVLAIAALCMFRGSARPGPPDSVPTLDGVTVWHPADGLGAVAAGFGDLWVDDRTRERLLRVDGRSGRVRAALPVRGRLAVAASQGAVWALQSGGGFGLGLRGPLLRIDPVTNTVRARIPLGAPDRPVLGFGVQAVGREVWVWGPRDILRVAERAGRITSRIAVAERHGELTGLAAGRRRVVAGTADGHLLRFDARTGRRTATLRFPDPSPSPRALSAGRLVVTTPGTVGAVDVADGRLQWRRRLGFRTGAALGGDGLVWVHSAATHERGDRLTAVDRATGRTVTSRLVPAFGSTGIAVGARHVAIATAGGALIVLASVRA
jgi:PQQ-like domain